MISVDLKDAYLQVPIHPDSRKFLRFVVDGKVLSVSSSVLRPLHGPSSVHQGHGSSVGHVTQPGRQDAALSRRLAHSRFLPSGGVAGEGLNSSVVLSTGAFGESRGIVSSSFSGSDIFKNGLIIPSLGHYCILRRWFRLVLVCFSCLIVVRHVRYRRMLYRSFYLSHHCFCVFSVGCFAASPYFSGCCDLSLFFA